MFVFEAMKRRVHTVGMDESADLASDALHFSGYRHLPVVDAENHVVGMLTPTDLLDFVQRRGAAEPVKVSEVMRSPVVSIRQDQDLEMALPKMRRANVHALPVLDNLDHLAGILTDVDVLLALAKDRPRGID
jgi:CBS-domain-containing membrane protein